MNRRRTGFEIREGSRMIAERIERARIETLEQKLKVVRSGLVVLVKQIDDELKTAA